MSNLIVKDALGATQTIKTTGDGSGGDPHVHHHNIDTIADGGDIAKGATDDTAVTDPSLSASEIALLKGLLTFLRVSGVGLGKAEDAGHSSGDTGVMALAVRNDTPGSLAGTDLDYGPLQLNSAGELRVAVSSSISLAGAVDTELPAAASLADATANPSTTSVGACLMVWSGVGGWNRLRAADTNKDLSAVAIGSIATVWTPASGKKVRLMGGTISVSAAVSVLFEDNSGGNYVHRTPKLLADTPYNFDLGQGRLLSAANNVLKATSSAAANVTGTLYGIEES